MHAASPAIADASKLEYRVKAAFLYNFARFVEWPENGPRSYGPVVIGVLGKDPFGSILDSTIRDKTAGGRPLVVRRLKDPREARECHLVFIGSDQRRYLSRVLNELDGSGALTVGELDAFLDEGGMINFAIEDRRVVLDINLDAAREAGLDVSSQLLKVARKVKYERR